MACHVLPDWSGISPPWSARRDWPERVTLRAMKLDVVFRTRGPVHHDLDLPPDRDQLIAQPVELIFQPLCISAVQSIRTRQLAELDPH
jgi:hypothetical protein